MDSGGRNQSSASSLPTPHRVATRTEAPLLGANSATSQTRRLDASRKQAGSSIGYGAVFLALLALTVLCVIGFLVARIFVARPSPSLPPVAGLTLSPFPSEPGVNPTGSVGPQGPVRVTLDPGQGYIGTLVVVSGEGWWPGEPVFVLLRPPQEENGSEYAYAAAVASEGGAFRTAFTFPSEARWFGQEWAEVIARGTRSGLQTSARFFLVAPTATHTSTPYPTLPPTDTPRPTNTPAPTNTPLPTATPTPEVVLTDWRGEYFANPSLAGAPILVRNDVAIDFNWGADSPDPRIPADRFSVRWTRTLRFREGLYELSVTVDDGVRLWMDGQLLIDEWHDSSLTTYSVTVQVSPGHHYLQIEYYEGLGGAMIQFSRERVKPATPTPPPTETVSPPPPSALLPDRWYAEYYANPALLGEPVLEREDAEIHFDWGTGSPGEEVPADGFSARWIGQIWLPAGTHRYLLTVDDGARVWLDGQLILDVWPAAIGETYEAQVHLEEGEHRFQVEYVELFVEARIHLWAETMAGPGSAAYSIVP